MSVSPYVQDLTLYDLYSTPGVATDLSHINSACNVEGYTGQKSLKQVLTGADAVIIAAGLPRKPGMVRDDLLLVNAGIAMELAKACATYCPQACALVITNPVNSTVPIFSEVYKKMGHSSHLFIYYKKLNPCLKTFTLVLSLFFHRICGIIQKLE